MTLHLRPYRASDEQSLIVCWNATLWADPIDARTWRSRFLLDPQFDPNTCLVAEQNGLMAGFCFGMQAADSPDGAIVAFGVMPDARRQGIGSTLLKRVLETWRVAGAARVSIGPYVPTYITPGVDEIAYPEALGFLQDQGFDVASRPISMRATLMGYRTSEDLVAKAQSTLANGYAVRPAVAEDILPLRRFLREHFPDWQTEVNDVLADLFVADSGRCTLLVAERAGGILGFAQSRAERFGPFGVDARLRGQGIGGLLLDRTLLAMRGRGYHVAWFLWTDERAARLYRQFGFEEVRRFSLFTINLRHDACRASSDV